MSHPSFFKRIHHTLHGRNATLRQPEIPADVAMYAREKRQFDNRPHTEKATMKDIYIGLTQEGLNLVLSGAVVPTFQEIPAEDTSSSLQVWFPNSLYGDKDDLATAPTLNGLKKRVDAGEFEVIGGTRISLVSLAMSLMRVAIAERDKAATAVLEAAVAQ